MSTRTRKQLAPTLIYRIKPLRDFGSGRNIGWNAFEDDRLIAQFTHRKYAEKFVEAMNRKEAS